MFRTLLAVAAFCVASSAICCAQSTPDPIRDALAPPDVVMAHADALDLSEVQKKAIIAHVSAAQNRFVGLQQKLEAAVDRLASILRQSRVDEAQALTQLDEVLKCERDVKRTQLALMIQVKNELTAAQQAQVRQYVSGAK